MGIQISDTTTRYGLISTFLHWLIAVTFIGLFGIGWYMVTLGYYDSWYTTLPHWHKSIGMLLFIVVLSRGGWRLFVRKPSRLEAHRSWEVMSSWIAHWLLGIGVTVVLVSGYFIPTAQGSSISVFNWFAFPAVLSLPDQEDISGAVHRYVAYFVFGLGIAHAGAALKHHFFDKDDTLRRILLVSSHRNPS